MNRNEYLSALRQALSGLPDEERGNALRYYEEYFDDAGPENEQKAAQDLGSPDEVARQILRDYAELTTVPPGTESTQGNPQGGAQQRTDAPYTNAAPQGTRVRRGITPLMLLLLLLLSPVWVPLAVALLAAAFGLFLGLAGCLIGLAAALASIPIALIAAGVGVIGFSFPLWSTSAASAAATLGTGLCALALGLFCGAVFVWLCRVCIPPLFRGLIALLRWPFDRIAGRRNHK